MSAKYGVFPKEEETGCFADRVRQGDCSDRFLGNYFAVVTNLIATRKCTAAS